MDQGFGQITDDGDRPRLRFERILNRPPSEVWRAITDSGLLLHWLPCDIVGDRREGAAITLAFWPIQVQQHRIPAEQIRLTGRIKVWEPPRVFEWTWDADVLRWELSPVGAGTRLEFTTWPGPTYPIAGTAAGWHVCLDQLGELLVAGRVAVPLVERATEDLRIRYAARMAG